MGMLKSLEVDYSYDIVEEFLSHYSLMCDILEPLVINLGRTDKYGENIRELFRIYHNIKSAASYMHLEPIVKLATLAEEVCSEARDLVGPANDAFIDWLLLVCDQLNKYKDDLENDADFFSVLEPHIINIPTKLD
ncbi:Hpt domain-containing protein [Campylobacter majalis]